MSMYERPAELKKVSGGKEMYELGKEKLKNVLSAISSHAPKFLDSVLATAYGKFTETDPAIGQYVVSGVKGGVSVFVNSLKNRKE